MSEATLEFEISGNLTVDNLTVDKIYMPEGISIGDNTTGVADQNNLAIAIGSKAGSLNQDKRTIAIGENAGYINQKDRAIAIGHLSGHRDQSNNTIAIGPGSGQYYQAEKAIAIGFEAGNTNQANRAIAIGSNAGNYNQEKNSIVIGYNAGYLNTHENTIIFNARDNIQLNSDISNAMFVAPIRDVKYDGYRNSYKIMVYNNANKEISFDSSYNGTGGGGGGSTIPGGSNTQLQYNNAGSFEGTSGLTWDGTELSLTGNLDAYDVSANNLELDELLFLSNEQKTDVYSTDINNPTPYSITKSATLFDISNVSATYYIDISGNSSKNGQNWDIFYDTSGATLNVDFGTNNLVVGSSLARKLTFNQLGQSASLMYMSNKWRLKNTGAGIS